MRIGIIGAGHVGTALGSRWSDAGHDVTYGVRDPGDPRHRGLGSSATVEAASSNADVVVIAVPWTAVEQVAPRLEVGDAIVIDATNQLASGTVEAEGEDVSSGARQIAGWTGSDRVVKAFNTTGSANMADSSYPGGTPLMPIAGDDEDAKAVVLDLAAELGFDAVDAGPLDAAVDLEHLARIWIRLAYQLGNGPDFAFSIVRR